jgi:hypothetical protein
MVAWSEQAMQSQINSIGDIQPENYPQWIC